MGRGAAELLHASLIQRTHVIVYVSVIPRMLIYHFLMMDCAYTSALREALYKLSVHSYVRFGMEAPDSLGNPSKVTGKMARRRRKWPEFGMLPLDNWDR